MHFVEVLLPAGAVVPGARPRDSGIRRSVLRAVGPKGGPDGGPHALAPGLLPAGSSTNHMTRDSTSWTPAP